MEMNLQYFRPLVGTCFAVAGANPPVEIRLEEASDRSGPSIEGRRHECFSLLFRCPSEPALPQGTFTLQQPGEQDITLFLVPIATIDINSRRYEAVFNQYV